MFTFWVIKDPELLRVIIRGQEVLELLVVELHVGEPHGVLGGLLIKDL